MRGHRGKEGRKLAKEMGVGWGWPEGTMGHAQGANADRKGKWGSLVVMLDDLL